MNKVIIVVPGKPIGKGRPRFARLPGGKMVAYTPAKTRSWESLAQGAAIEAMAGRERSEGPVAVDILVVHEEPTGWPTWKRGNVLPTVKPDCDNVVKALDAFNGVVWKDDAQIVDLRIRKVYDLIARLEVAVTFLDDAPAQVKSKQEMQALRTQFLLAVQSN